MTNLNASLPHFSGFGTKATCFLFLVFVNDGTTAMIFLTIGVGSGGLTIAGTNQYVSYSSINFKFV